jgi:metal-responsive CopG/Arc/MetJ family transcriptional regulator
MQESITISIPKEIKRALDRERKAKGISRSAVVSDALKKYLALREIAELRQKMIPKARAQGIYSDEDVFARVS